MTPQEQWIDFCSKNEQDICLYDQPFWLDAVCGGREHWNVFLAEERGKIIAALPYHIKQKLGIRYITMPQLTQHNGIWLKQTESEKVEKRIHHENNTYKLLIDQIEQSGVHMYQQCFSPEVTNWQPFYWQGYKQKTLYTFYIDCPCDLTAAEQNFRSSTRTHLRKAQQACTVSEFDDIELFHKINSMTYARQHLQNPVSLPLLKRLYQACKDHQAVKMLMAKDQSGAVCNVALYVYDATTVYALMSGGDPAKRSLNFQTVLTYEGIKFACETCRRLDFEGSMVQGIANSIIGFGAEMHPYFMIKKVLTKTPLISLYLLHKLYR